MSPATDEALLTLREVMARRGLSRRTLWRRLRGLRRRLVRRRISGGFEWLVPESVADALPAVSATYRVG